MRQTTFTAQWHPDQATLDDVRPEDCDCSPRCEGLPCWACYRDGFETPNPEV
jgi:hypothetical protein